SVEEQRLLRLREPELPGNARVLDGRQWGRTRPTRVARDRDEVRVRLGDADRDRPHARFGDELHRDRRARIDVLQVVDQLREVFDGIDVVMWRRRDERDAGNRVPRARDDLVDFVAGQLPAFARLGALGDLDLELR